MRVKTGPITRQRHCRVSSAAAGPGISDCGVRSRERPPKRDRGGGQDEANCFLYLRHCLSNQSVGLSAPSFYPTARKPRLPCDHNNQLPRARLCGRTGANRVFHVPTRPFLARFLTRIGALQTAVRNTTDVILWVSRRTGLLGIGSMEGARQRDKWGAREGACPPTTPSVRLQK